MIELDYLLGCLIKIYHRWWLWYFQPFLACLSLLSEHQHIDEILHSSDAYAVHRVVLE